MVQKAKKERAPLFENVPRLWLGLTVVSIFLVPLVYLSGIFDLPGSVHLTNPGIAVLAGLLLLFGVGVFKSITGKLDREQEIARRRIAEKARQEAEVRQLSELSSSGSATSEDVDVGNEPPSPTASAPQAGAPVLPDAVDGTGLFGAATARAVGLPTPSTASPAPTAATTTTATTTTEGPPRAPSTPPPVPEKKVEIEAAPQKRRSRLSSRARRAIDTAFNEEATSPPPSAPAPAVVAEEQNPTVSADVDADFDVDVVDDRDVCDMADLDVTEEVANGDELARALLKDGEEIEPSNSGERTVVVTDPAAFLALELSSSSPSSSTTEEGEGEETEPHQPTRSKRGSHTCTMTMAGLTPGDDVLNT